MCVHGDGSGSRAWRRGVWSGIGHESPGLRAVAVDLRSRSVSNRHRPYTAGRHGRRVRREHRTEPLVRSATAVLGWGRGIGYSEAVCDMRGIPIRRAPRANELLSTSSRRATARPRPTRWTTAHFSLVVWTSDPTRDSDTIPETTYVDGRARDDYLVSILRLALRVRPWRLVRGGVASYAIRSWIRYRSRVWRTRGAGLVGARGGIRYYYYLDFIYSSQERESRKNASLDSYA